jgi:AcrR family transcriptional regulator
MAGRNSSYNRIMDAALRLFAERGASEVNVSDLAAAAGVARSTVYAHLSSPQSLFENVASELAGEMHERVSASSRPDSSPTLRLAEGIRFFIRRAHEEPQWGRFIVRFAFTEKSLQGMWSGPPVRDLMAGIEAGLYSLRPEQLPSSVAMMGGSVLGAMFLVLEGHKSWREAGSDAAELLLRAFGVPSDQARSIATAELPQLLSSIEPRKDA